MSTLRRRRIAQMVGLPRCSEVFRPRYGMDVLLDWQHYHQLNVILLSAIGLWPFDNKLVLRLKRFIGCFLTFLCCIGQLATFFTVDYTRRLLLNNAPCIFVAFAILVKYTSFLAAGTCIKRVTETINNDWKDLTSKEEIQIIEKYIKSGRFHTRGFAIFVCPLATGLILFPFSSVILDIVIPLNKSRSRTFPIMFDLLFDQKKYFYLAAFSYDWCIFFGALVFVSTETLLIVYIQHACALFEVTRRRIETLLCVAEARNVRRRANVTVIGQVVEFHSKAIRQCKTLKEDFLPSYIILLVFGTLSLGAHLLRCTQTFARHEFSESLMSAMFGLGILGYMFHLTTVLQKILDWSTDIFDVLYDTEWFDFPISTRKLILFCMLNTMKPAVIDITSILVPSYEGFSLVAKMTMSYATALHSFQ